MAVICFSSLKGGVGKTTLSVSVASAFAERGCETLLIDLDPAEHASRFFSPETEVNRQFTESPMAKLFLGAAGSLRGDADGDFNSLIDEALSESIPLVRPVKPRFAVMPAGPELRHFFWGRGARVFKELFPRLIAELNTSYDYIIIDTPPDYNVLTRNAVAAADLVVVPIDASLMSIHCLERLFAHCAHIKGPTWSIIRTMVNRQASRVQQMSNQRLSERLALCSKTIWEEEDEDLFDEAGELNLNDADGFIAMFDSAEKSNSAAYYSETQPAAKTQNSDERPIYLLNSIVYRTEDQNKLTFLGKTAFDLRATARLAEQYMSVAREVDQILSYVAEEEPINLTEDFLPPGVEHLPAAQDLDWEVSKLRSSTC